MTPLQIKKFDLSSIDFSALKLTVIGKRGPSIAINPYDLKK